MTTWAQVHVDDAVRGADQRAWRVAERTRGPRWLGAGTAHDRFVLEQGDRQVVASRELHDPVDVVERADHSALASATDALIRSGLAVEILREATVSDTTEDLQGVADHPSGVCAHPAEAISPTPKGGRVCTECFAQLPPDAVVECGHPFEKRSRLKSGKVKCTACKTFITEDVQGAPQAETPAPDGSTGGGAVLTGVSAAAIPTPAQPAPAADPFSAPAGVERREPPRGQWGWYKLPHPVTGEVDKIWPRVSTVAGTLEDEYNLTQWKLRKAVHGLAKRPDLIASAAAANPDTDKSTLDSLVRTAMDVAEASARANYGTAVHKFAERLDNGESVASMGVPANCVPEVEAYARALKEHGLTVLPEYSERTVVGVDPDYAGTIDRVVRDRAGNLYILDLKTGDDLSYSWLKIVIQQALYSRAVRYMCLRDFSGYESTPPVVDQAKALILHLPFGKAKGDIYGVPIDKGWQAALVSFDARRMRTEAKGWNWLVQPQSPADVVRLHLDRAATVEALLEVQGNAIARHIWTPDLEAHALSRYDVIRASSVRSQSEAAALWNELHPVGRWTEAVDDAAHSALSRQLEAVAA